MEPSPMEQVVVKTEMQNNGEILLFYVDENGENEEGVLTTVENIENPDIQLQPSDSYIVPDQDRNYEISHTSEYSVSRDRWTEEETQRLLIFYNDNKKTFLSGSTKRKHLWTIACKTMLMNKNPNACDMKLRNLKAKYIETYKTMRHTGDLSESLLSLCHQAFSDNPYFKSIVESSSDDKGFIQLPVTQKLDDGIVVLKKVNVNKSIDEKVEKMLQLYIKYKEKFKKEHFTRNLWETIALELGEEDGVYWQKRFLNFKQHYICLLEKRKDGITEINWPYMQFYDEIFKDDEEFRKKYHFVETDIVPETPFATNHDHDWLETEKMALVKYNYDCFEDFQDPKIPNHFLWTEIGRLLDKSPEVCKNKYIELKQGHFTKYLDGDYDIRERTPLDIVFDYIISKETEIELTKDEPHNYGVDKVEEIDDLAQFLYDNVEMYKDPICYYVCWGIISYKLKRSVVSCRRQWEELVTLYKSILNDKKEHPDMQIDWRYIELFDRIFDYGMDTNLLDGYEKTKEPKEFDKIGVKRVNINMSDTERKPSEEDESFEEKNSKRTGDSKAFKILEYYQKNKDKFSTTNRNKHNLWEILAKQIGISATQCAHRFRNLKQVYTAYVQREINKPEMPIVWPYYPLCKKVFGYRAIKAKLKNGKNDSDTEEWSAREINELINYFAQNFDEITNNVDDMSKWAPLSKILDKSKVACKDKFIELRKSYRKLKTQITRNPNVKISWKYFNTFEDIYNSREKMNQSGDAMEVDEQYEENNEVEEDDYQCIIVMPEDADFSNIDSSQVIIEEVTNETSPPMVPETKPPPKWTRQIKKRLLVHYINYVRTNRGKEINSKEMWREIAAKLDKKPITCRKMLIRLKNLYKKNVVSDDKEKKLGPMYRLIEKAIKLKPKFVKVDPNKTEQEKIYKDVPMDTEKVVSALQYYTKHIEDFVSPKFEKKFLWMELANFISEPVNKVFNKVNYLQQAYNNDQITEENAQFLDALREITAKELAITLIADLENDGVKEYPERSWVDEETEQLLQWYLSNLDKFKNPKFVRSYLWIEASNILKRSPLDCSKKMSEIRTQYRNMVRENSEELVDWKFYDLCQKIYGTGKKASPQTA